MNQTTANNKSSQVFYNDNGYVEMRFAGITELSHNATMLYYMSEEGREGKEAFLEKRAPAYRDSSRFPRGG